MASCTPSENCQIYQVYNVGSHLEKPKNKGIPRTHSINLGHFRKRSDSESLQLSEVHSADLKHLRKRVRVKETQKEPKTASVSQLTKTEGKPLARAGLQREYSVSLLVLWWQSFHHKLMKQEEERKRKGHEELEILKSNPENLRFGSLQTSELSLKSSIAPLSPPTPVLSPGFPSTLPLSPTSLHTSILRSEPYSASAVSPSPLPSVPCQVPLVSVPCQALSDCPVEKKVKEVVLNSNLLSRRKESPKKLIKKLSAQAAQTEVPKKERSVLATPLSQTRRLGNRKLEEKEPGTLVADLSLIDLSKRKQGSSSGTPIMRTKQPGSKQLGTDSDDL